MAKLSASGSFVIGFYDGSATNANEVTVDVQVRDNSGSLLNSEVMNGSQALSYFDGTAPAMPDAEFTNSGYEGVTITMTVTTTGVGAGFSGDFILGDPPDTQTIEKTGITGHAFTDVARTYTDGVLTSVAQYSSPGHLLQDVAISHGVSAFGLTGLEESVVTNIAGSADTEKDVYRDASGHNQLVVAHLANGTIGISAEVSGLTFDFDTVPSPETIRGYVPGADSFDIAHTLFSNFGEMIAHAAQIGGNVEIAFNATDVLTLTGVTLSELNAHASDFHFI
jgi:hypothetical protein